MNFNLEREGRRGRREGIERAREEDGGNRKRRENKSGHFSRPRSTGEFNSLL